MTISVNGQEIPESAIEFEFTRLVDFYSQHLPPERVQAQVDALRERARDQAIGAKLLIEEAQRLEIQVPATDVDARQQTMIESAGGESRFHDVLSQQNLSVEELRAGIERGRRVDLLIEKITREVDEPTEEEMEAYFKAHEEDYQRPDRAQAQHILIQVPGGEDRGEARRKLLDVRRQIQEGASFADMAAAHSACPSGKKTGGSLGWFSRGMMVGAFDEAVFSMEVGALSDLIDTELGVHVIFKLGEESGGTVEFSDAAEQVRELLRHMRRGAAISHHVNELKSKAVIEEG